MPLSTTIWNSTGSLKGQSEVFGPVGDELKNLFELNLLPRLCNITKKTLLYECSIETVTKLLCVYCYLHFYCIYSSCAWQLLLNKYEVIPQGSMVYFEPWRPFNLIEALTLLYAFWISWPCVSGSVPCVFSIIWVVSMLNSCACVFTCSVNVWVVNCVWIMLYRNDMWCLTLWEINIFRVMRQILAGCFACLMVWKVAQTSAVRA